MTVQMPTADRRSFQAGVPVIYAAILHACRTYRLPVTRFGRLAVNDPRLIGGIRNGRILRPATAAKVTGFIATLGDA